MQTPAASWPLFSVKDVENDRRVHNPGNFVSETMKWSILIGGEFLPITKIELVQGTEAYTVFYTKTDCMPQKWIIRPSDYKEE
jgi:hypothetical protein